MDKRITQNKKHMKKFVIAILLALTFSACGSNNGQATLKDLTSELKVIKDAPPYPGPAYNDEHWKPIIYNLEKKVRWFNTDLEGYIIPTKSEVDGLEVVAPCEVYSVEFRYPFINVTLLCKVKLNKDIQKEEISNNRRDGSFAFVYFIGYDGNSQCQYVGSSKELNDAEPLLMVRTSISPEVADGFEKINEIHIVNGNNAEAEQTRMNYNNMIRR